MSKDVGSARTDRTPLASTTSDGVEYSLYDNVKVYDAEFSELHIGKIAKLWLEKESGGKRVLIRWFFRSQEVKPDGEDENPKQLFLAFGKGTGVSNESDLDAIVGKCKVLCTSTDLRNKQPSANDVENSEFFFSHVYNVDLRRTSPVEKVADKLGLNVVFNKQEWVTEEKGVKKTSQNLKDDANLKQEPLGNSLSQSKKRPRDEEPISDTHKKKLVQQADLRKGQVSGEASKAKKIKDRVLFQKEALQSGNHAKITSEKSEKGVNAGDAISNETDFERPSLSKEGRGEGLTPEVSTARSPLASKARALDREKGSMPGEISPSEKVLPLPDSTLEAKAESLLTKSSLGQVDNRESLHEENQKAEKDQKKVPEDTQMLEDMEAMETDLEFMDTKASEILSSSKAGKEEAERSLLADSEPSISGKDKTSARKQIDKSTPELKGSPKVAFSKDVKSDVAKKTKMATEIEAPKKPMSTSEIVKAMENRKIFKELPWEENLQKGISNGKVLLLQNLDPFITSAGVRDMLKENFQGLSDARVLPQETNFPYGQALVVFESKFFAECALEAIETNCLVVENNKRALIACKVKEPSNEFRFPGDLALDKLKLGRNLQTEDYKKAVSTSHCSQPNTIEFEMAMEWRRHQEITHTSRVELFRRQRKELNEMRNSGNKKDRRSKEEAM